MKHRLICVSENLLNGDSPYPHTGPIGKVLPMPTAVEIVERAGGDGSDDELNSSPVSSLDKRHAHTHTMSTRRVCWHRNTSISMTEHSLSVRVSIAFLKGTQPRRIYHILLDMTCGFQPACYNCTLLSCNRRRKMLKVVKAKKY